MSGDDASCASFNRPPIIFCRRHNSRRPQRHPIEKTLTDLGRIVKEVQDGPIRFDAECVVWIQGNANWFPQIRSQLAACPPQARPLVLHWFSEPLPPPRASGLPRPRLNLKEVAKILLRDARITDLYSNAARLRSMVRKDLIDLLVVTTPARQQFLAEQGITAHFVPLGYERSNHGRDLGLERTRDVIFLGAIVPRRRKLLSRLQRDGVQLDQMGGWFDPAFWGQNRTRLLNQTKIFINIARHPGELPGMRLILGMANKCLVVSEPIYEPGPYVPGKHFIASSVNEMPDAIRYYLDHPEKRQVIADAGHRLVTETLTLERSVKRILTLVDEKTRQRAQSCKNKV